MNLAGSPRYSGSAAIGLAATGLAAALGAGAGAGAAAAWPTSAGAAGGGGGGLREHARTTATSRSLAFMAGASYDTNVRIGSDSPDRARPSQSRAMSFKWLWRLVVSPLAK